MTLTKPFHILVVEDNLADVELLKFLFKNSSVAIELSFVYDGLAATDFLQGKEPFAQREIPDLVLLDLNLPKKDGRQILREIKADASLCSIPVIFVSTSSSYREITDAYCRGASAFISKPPDLAVYQATIDALTEFWCKRTSLPTRLEHRA